MSHTTLSKEDYETINNIMTYLQGKEGHNHNADIITQLFSAHNLAFPTNPEYGKSCGGCRTRVYARLNNYWKDTRTSYGY